MSVRQPFDMGSVSVNTGNPLQNIINQISNIFGSGNNQRSNVSAGDLAPLRGLGNNRLLSFVSGNSGSAPPPTPTRSPDQMVAATFPWLNSEKARSDHRADAMWGQHNRMEDWVLRMAGRMGYPPTEREIILPGGSSSGGSSSRSSSASSSPSTTTTQSGFPSSSGGWGGGGGTVTVSAPLPPMPKFHAQAPTHDRIGDYAWDDTPTNVAPRPDTTARPEPYARDKQKYSKLLGEEDE